ncbi:hypothetical protein BaRGS_00026346 [Batillaria attramentaria]|uniref:Uncharacterized protein n=1 Tax=Batillaria attramentaria TaxID=370345 RepID=A0ABD0K596_9CAEN
MFVECVDQSDMPMSTMEDRFSGRRWSKNLHTGYQEVFTSTDDGLCSRIWVRVITMDMADCLEVVATQRFSGCLSSLAVCIQKLVLDERRSILTL